MNNKNSPSKETTGCITSETKNASNEIECEGMKLMWKRKCPKCNDEIFYSGKRPRDAMKRAESKKSVCNKCAQLGSKHPNRDPSSFKRGKDHWNYGNNMPKESIEKMRKSLTGRKLPNHVVKKMITARTGKKRSDEARTNISNGLKGRKLSPQHAQGIAKRAKVRHATPENNPMYGKTHKPETRAKIREKYLSRMEKILGYPVVPNFNENACDYFNTLNKKNGWNLQHAKNGGEVEVFGYSLDAYDKERNIVVEYDEPRHYDLFGNLRKKDIIRMNEIIKQTGCSFYRYNEKTNELRLYRDNTID